MSTGPLGMAGGIAGTPYAQQQGGEAERVKENAEAQRLLETERRAAEAAGIAATEEEQQAADRDADGRRIWEQTSQSREGAQESAASDDAPRRGRDATGSSGTHLDLTG